MIVLIISHVYLGEILPLFRFIPKKNFTKLSFEYLTYEDRDSTFMAANCLCDGAFFATEAISMPERDTASLFLSVTTT